MRGPARDSRAPAAETVAEESLFAHAKRALRTTVWQPLFSMPVLRCCSDCALNQGNITALKDRVDTFNR